MSAQYMVRVEYKDSHGHSTRSGPFSSREVAEAWAVEKAKDPEVKEIRLREAGETEVI